MAKIGIVVLADTETHGDLGRVVNGLLTAREAGENGDEVRLIFDGAGTRWIGELANPEHRSHRLYEAVKDQITGACRYCAGAFGATAAVEAADVPPARRVPPAPQPAPPDGRRLRGAHLLIRSPAITADRDTAVADELKNVAVRP